MPVQGVFAGDRIVKTILIVDDTPQNIQMISAVLKDLFRVKVATGGEKALALVAGADKPDLILLDVEMPGMDGYEVCRRLKADASTVEIPVIFLTARTEVDDETKGFEVGAVDYIHKPFSPPIVRARVHTQLALRDAKTEAQTKRQKVESLLHSSGQGFLSFGPDLVGDDEYSAACEVMLDCVPAGHDVVSLLFTTDPAGAELARAILPKIAAETDEFRRQMRLSLLPALVHRGGKSIKLEYRPLQNGHMMLVLTDVTKELALAAAVAREKLRLEFIVNVVTEGRDIFTAVDEYRAFMVACAQAPDRANGDLLDLSYRMAHTFKGVFAQFSFLHLPEALHRLESEFDRLRAPDATRSIRDAVAAADPDTALAADLSVLSDILGPGFVESHGVALLPANLAEQLEDLAEQALRDQAVDWRDPRVRAMLAKVADLRKISLRQALENFGKMVAQVADRLDKQVAPLEVSGDDVLVCPKTYGPFLRSLVHVFRNAVTHGIEAADVRLTNGKDDTGHIACMVRRGDGAVIIEIADDGAGLDMERLREAAGGILGEAAIAALSEAELCRMIFSDRVTTAREITDLCGRGVGLAAVMGLLGQMGGSVAVESRPGHGTRFHFTLPHPLAGCPETGWLANNA
jgi:CheY-like chemotaxis protein